MLGAEEVQSFRRDGYVVVPDVLTGHEVAALRSVLEPRFARPAAERPPGDIDDFIFDPFSRIPEIRWLLFHANVLAVLRSLLGDDYVLLREAVAQREQYGHWHKDTTTQERAGHTFHLEDDCLMVEAAFYLQDDTLEHGGGLEVSPGSHCEPDRYARRGFLERVRGKLADGPRPPDTVVRLPVTAGAMVVFDFRIDHRATHGTEPARPPGREKLALFQACSTRSPHVETYQRFIAGRPTYVYLDGFSWPDDLAAEAERHDVTLG